MTTPWRLVVGGSRGIGAATVLALAGRGYPIVLTYRERADAARSVAQQAEQRGAAWVRPIQLDLAEPKSAEALAIDVIKEFGAPRSYLHCAGTVQRTSLWDTTIEDFTAHLTSNTVSVFALLRSIGVAMHSSGGGSIVLVSSIIGAVGARHRVSYGAAKAALLGLATCAAVELAPTVRVNVVCPGVVATDVTQGLMADPSALAALTERVPLMRLGEAAEVADVLVFLAEDASFVTGAVWSVDGGAVARISNPAGDPVR